jgi:signal transduction histidine kinase
MKSQPEQSLRSKNAQLQKELAAKNRDLQIEASLERVRVIALLMREPADMLEVCRSICAELVLLGVNDIRNVQTAIIYESKRIYINYEYYRLHDKTLITEVDYNHPVQMAFIERMLSDPEGSYSRSFEGTELKEWFDYQKTTTQFVDTYLENAASLNYYWFSLGPVALGISTYTPLTDEGLQIFKRFRNVFGLAYRRYADLGRALAQAKEALLETSLEKVRAQALGMRKPEELLGICKALFTELQNLGFTEARNAMINVFDDEKSTFLIYDYSPDAGQTITHHFYNGHPVIEKQVKDIRSAADAFSETVFTGEDLEDWKAFRKQKGEKADPRVDNIIALYYYFYAVGTAAIGMSTFSSIDEEKKNVLKRFRNVFDFAYRRYTDVAQAEAQAREAQIEFGLERVRARAMAMQNSGELSDLVTTLFDELTKLDFALSWCVINIINESTLVNTVWLANLESGKAPETFQIQFADYPFPNAMKQAWKERRSNWVYELKGEEKQVYFEFLFNETEFGRIPEATKAAIRAQERQVASFTFSNFGGLQTVGGEPLSEESLDILSRFGKVFDMTYTRFNDLKQAEEQAREAQIELALERVRARTMAMQHSEELAETAYILFRQFMELGEDPDQISIGIMNEAERVIEFWITLHGNQTNIRFEASINEPTVMNKLFTAWKERKRSLVIDLSGEPPNDYLAYRASLGGTRANNEKPEARRVINAAFFSKGFITISASAPRPIETIRVLERFAGVFEGTYTRFLDLKKAEAQVREAQIELALERVRAKTMAMHNSQDVGDTVVTMFDELVKLGVETLRCGILINADPDKMEVWTASSAQNGGVSLIIGRLDMNIHPLLKGIYNAWAEKRSFFTSDLDGEDMVNYYTAINSLPDYPVRFDIEALPRTQVHSDFFFAEGAIFAFTADPIPIPSVQIFKRFAGVFGQTYRRYLDLQKAEAQARQAQIEVAMEKVRSRSLAMQKPGELVEVAQVLRQEMALLGVEELETSSIYIHDDNNGKTECWYAIKDEHKLVADHMVMNLRDTWVGKQMLRFYHSDKTQISIPMKGENRKEWINYCSTKSKLLDGYYGDNIPDRTYHLCKFSGGYMGAASPGDISAESWELLKRAATVFSFAYTRFSDLQQAQAQAREAQIEAALERVRSRTMGMQKSEELQEIIKVVYEQFVHLNIPVEHAGFIMDYNTRDDMHIWLADKRYAPAEITIPYFDSPHWNSFNEAKQKGSNFFANYLNFEEKNRFYQDLFKLIPDTTDGTREYYLTCSGLAGSTVLLENVGLYIENFAGIPYTDDENGILMRFGKVFQQTYTRFNDLKQAEAQARDAKIEAALERTRTQSMLMQHSTELEDTLRVFHQQVLLLGIQSAFSFLWLPDEEKDRHIFWAAWAENDSKTFKSKAIDYPLDRNEPATAQCLVDWKSNEPVYSYQVPPAGVKNYFAAWQELIDGVEQLKPEYFQGGLYYVEAFMKYGCFGVMMENDLSGEEKKILGRFAIEFERTYTRFLDLQRAEAQAREAQIEASLERVRGKAMAMRNSGDLSAAASTVFAELRNLGINPIRSGVGLINGESRKASIYSNTSTQTAADLALMGEVTLAGHPVFEQQYQSWLNHQNYFVALGGKELASYYKILSAGLKADLGIRVKKNQKEYGHWFMFSEGFLYAWSDKEYTDGEIKILGRFKNIIELTFRRYIELQKSEDSARDAVRQASLDRVRGEIASMRTTADLERITPLIWNELTILGVPFIRCGVFIMNETQQVIHTYLSTPDGKAIAAFQLHYNADTGNGVNQTALTGWRNKQAVTLNWTEKEFRAFSHNLVEQGELDTEEGYLTEHPPTGLDLHFFPFLQGMLYVGNTEPLSDDDKDLMQSLADAFSTAYARYEDFNRLELAKKEVERTLTDLKAAQTRLIQSEKMASLGELTAGIAHEIQNPLNFVNNFSEVNQEMIDELEEALNAGNIEEGLAIAADIKQNEQKINHHGKRADSIVKGMLQHSRTSGGEKQPININSLADEFLKLSYHGLRAKDKAFNAEMLTNFDPDLPKINAVGQDIGRVFLNLFNNAFYAVNQKQKTNTDYKPEVTVSTSSENGQIIIKVKDNGIGIPDTIREKIMQPFFTTKPTGEGTGLGLSLTYDMVVKGHGGSIQVNSVEGEGSEFIIILPII